MIAGTSSDTMTMYDGVVGMPMPSTMPATAVSTSARSSEFCDERDDELREHDAEAGDRHDADDDAGAGAGHRDGERIARAVDAARRRRCASRCPRASIARSSATGMQASAPASAHSGAE